MTFLNCFARSLLSVPLCFLSAVLLIRPRYSRRVTLGVLVLSALTVTLSDALITYLYELPAGDVSASRFPLLVAAPYIAVSLLLSRDRGWQPVFTSLLAVSLCMMGSAVAQMSAYLYRFPFSQGLTKLAFSGVELVFLLRWFRPPLLRMLSLTPRGWFAFSFIPLFLIFAYYYLVNAKPLNVPALLCLGFETGSIFLMLFELFIRIADGLRQREEERVMRIEVDALAHQQTSLHGLLEQMRIQRHDQRHYLTLLEAMLREGRAQEALESLSRLIRLQDEAARAEIHCENVAVNAIVATFAARARSLGVEPRIALDIPQELPGCDSAVLATVFANALENALGALGDVPMAARRLTVASQRLPCQLFVRIGNACAAPPRFDQAEGIPLPRGDDPSHGYGSRSIREFARQHGAQLDYDIRADYFELRLLLPLEQDGDTPSPAPAEKCRI